MKFCRTAANSYVYKIHFTNPIKITVQDEAGTTGKVGKPQSIGTGGRKQDGQRRKLDEKLQDLPVQHSRECNSSQQHN